MKKADKKFWIIVFVLIVAALAFHIIASTHANQIDDETKEFLEEYEIYYMPDQTLKPISSRELTQWNPKPIEAKNLRCVGKPKRIKKSSNFKIIKECNWNKRQQKMIWKICRQENYSFELCVAQAKLESTWNADAIGDGGRAWGAWQIHPEVWYEVIGKLGYQREDMFNLEKACWTYIYIMKSHFRRYDSVEFALLAWRWGGDRAMWMMDNGEYSYYTNEIIRLSQRYERRKKS